MQVTDYSGLITPEHADKPKFVGLVSTLAQCFVDAQNLLASIPPAFDLDNAVGVPLDAVGKWVGLTRSIPVPITNVYFSFDTAAVGFDQGNWAGPFDPLSGLISLDDETYRLQLRAKIAANNWNGTLGGAAAILNQIFVGPTYAFLQDRQDMSFDIGLAGQQPSALLQALLKSGYIPIKPEGVHLGAIYLTSVNTAPLFGFDLENSQVSGFEVGAWGTNQ